MMYSSVIAGLLVVLLGSTTATDVKKHDGSIRGESDEERGCLEQLALFVEVPWRKEYTSFSLLRIDREACRCCSSIHKYEPPWDEGVSCVIRRSQGYPELSFESATEVTELLRTMHTLSLSPRASSFGYIYLAHRSLPDRLGTILPPPATFALTLLVHLSYLTRTARRVLSPCQLVE